MDKNGSAPAEFSYYCSVKVHRSICLELIKLLDRIAQIVAAIESVRPNGISALCSLRLSMDKAKSLIQYCSKSSKIYLAITGEKIVSRCEKLRGTLDSCLSQIQSIVPLLLAAKISGIIEDLRSAKLQLDSPDKEAGKIILSLMQKDITTTSTSNDKELEALQIAASKLRIASPFDVLVEKGCIKRLVSKIDKTSPRKTKVLKYLFYLLKKYGSQITQGQGNASAGPDLQEKEADSLEPPEEFKCPISTRLMYDPSIIASGRTFERLWIERWIREGNDTCPVAHTKLDHLSVTPNSAMKSLIEKWCRKHGISVANPRLESVPTLVLGSETSCPSSAPSFGNEMDDLGLVVSNVSLCSWSDDSGRRHGNALNFLSSLADLSWESQCKIVEDAKCQFEGEDQAHCLSTSYSYVNILTMFMKEASKLGDLKAQRDGSELLFAILRCNRNETPRFEGDAIHLLTSYLASEMAGKALAILEILSYEQHAMSTMLASGLLPSILTILQNPATEFHSLAMKILCNLSINTESGHHMLHLNYIPTLVRFLSDRALARLSVETLKNLCGIEEARLAVSERIEHVVAVGRLLESRDEQEHALEILLSLCRGGDEYCHLVIKSSDEIVESLFFISVNGNSRARVIAMELLQLLGHRRPARARSDVDSLCNSKAKRPSSKAFRLLGREVSRFAKSR